MTTATARRGPGSWTSCPSSCRPRDWAKIEAAVIQRASLADMILRDVYGPQTLIRNNVLPPHLVTGHPQFLRPLCGTTPAHDVHVHLYSADLARGARRQLEGDGQSRADAPGGLGYALENRLVVAQTFPESFGDMRVARLAAFFNAYKESVLELGQSRRDRAVLLTPGPYNEAYFEHVYLAHYLGLTLVQGDDLAVRDGEVFIKTLTGLERVAAIFRRVDCDFCDPLEFRGDSALGVPGLAEAVRAGGVVLANALGGGVIESPAMDAYLPAVCRALLGEDLKIPDIATVWCGTEWGRKEALARHQDLHPARCLRCAAAVLAQFQSARLGADLSARGTRTLAGAHDPSRRDHGAAGSLAAGPGAGVRERQVRRQAGQLARLRRLDAERLDGDAGRADARRRRRHGAARCRCSRARRPRMPGCCRTRRWTLSPCWPTAARTLEVKRQGESAPSRAMDNLFWLGRYAERTESFVRILRAVAARLSDEPAAALDVARKLLIPFSQASDAPIDEIADEQQLAEELQLLIYNPRSSRGLQRLLGRVEQTAWSVRDRLSLDTWRTIHALGTMDAPPDMDAPFAAPAARFYLDALVRRAAALSGLAAENMTRGPNWLFIDMGRRVERAQHLAWLVRQTVGMADARETEHIRIAAGDRRQRHDLSLALSQCLPAGAVRRSAAAGRAQSALLRLPAGGDREPSARTAAHHAGPAQRRAAHPGA